MGMGLRTFCIENALDAVSVSKLERGRVKPPTGAALEAYAHCLGLKPGTEGWREFESKAHTCAGESPPSLMDDECLVRALPVIFWPHGRAPTACEIKRLIDLVRRS